VRRLEDPRAGTSIRLSKGVHAVLDGAGNWGAALTVSHDKVRVSFAVPWEGMLLLGTTDTLHEGGPDDVRVTETDVTQVLDEASLAVEGLSRERVRGVFGGLRVLPGGEGETANARRETVYSRGPEGMLSVAGGKLTTYRRIALEVLSVLRAELGLQRLDRRPLPLPGAEGPNPFDRWPDLDPRVQSHLWNHYGTLAGEVLAPAAEHPELLGPLHSEGPDIAAQVVYARDSEWAQSVEDVLRRRTTLSVRGLADSAVRERVDALFRADVAEPTRR
jgi:glycerol-3-phosphate dehydrogenase